VTIDPKMRGLQMRAASEAWDVLHELGAAKASEAESLKQSVSKGLDPHPRTVREVYNALLEALMDVKVKSGEQSRPTGLSGFFFGRGVKVPSREAVRDVIKRFEEAFVRKEHGE
jgi:hypothetical protein